MNTNEAKSQRYMKKQLDLILLILDRKEATSLQKEIILSTLELCYLSGITDALEKRIELREKG